jgi:hypothetical protein
MPLPIPPFRDDGWLPEGHHEATWDEIVVRFGGEAISQRARLTAKLLDLRNGLRAHGVTGTLLLNGSYVSAKPEPADFDVLFIGPVEIQAMKDQDPGLASLLDAEQAERVCGYSLFYIPNNSPVLETLITLWDLSKEGVAKGSVQVSL